MTRFYPLRQLPFALALGLTLTASIALAQTDKTPDATASVTVKPEAPKVVQTAPVKSAAVTPFIHSVRDVELGMAVDEARKKLGRPEVEDATGMYFTLSGGDAVQIGLDDDKKVRTAALIYGAGSKSAPTLKDIFGNDVDNVEGDTYKIVRYPDAGYWVSYSRSNSKDKPIVVVTMRKLG